MTPAVVALLLLLAPPANAETVCKTQRDTAEHWRWRMIEGRKCWYPGRDRRPKDMLTWEQVVERKYYTREELVPHDDPPAGPDEIEYHPDEMVNSFDERWRLR